MGGKCLSAKAQQGLVGPAHAPAFATGKDHPEKSHIAPRASAPQD